MTLCSVLNRKWRSMSAWAAWTVLSATWVAFAPATHAQTPLNTTVMTLLGQAPADECYTGLGLNTVHDYPPCAAGQILKVNQAYVWSEADSGGDVWFGTTANPLCLTEGGVTQGSIGTTPYQTPSWVCEYADSPYVPPLPGSLGDFRPPKIYVYNKATGVLTDKTPTDSGPSGSLDPLLKKTSGLRAATITGNYVIFSGPSLTGGLNFFAFQIDTQQWVAKGTLAGYDNIRKFLTVDGVIYAGVGKTSTGGSVLRYTGSFASIPPPSPGQGAGTCSACFTFDTVGALDSDAAYLALHNGRVYVSTWPHGGLGGIYMGPPVPSGGYTRANANQWLKVWEASQYDPDPVVATSYSGGALMSFGGYLYYGTINVPFASYDAWVAAYGEPTTQQQAEQVIAFTFRPAVLFRTAGFDTSPVQIDLLYGATSLWVYTPPAGGGTTGTWAQQPNTMPAANATPLYGGPGIGNEYNVYIWSMAIWQNELWVGTFDWSWVVAQSEDITTTTSFPFLAKPYTFTPPPSLYGADLFFFPDSNSAAVAEDTTGLGNITSYGVRNLLPSATDPNSMYVGMANNANLLGDPTNPPVGGWELILLQPNPTTAKQLKR